MAQSEAGLEQAPRVDVSSRGERWLACLNSHSAHMLACDKTPPTDDQITDYLFPPFFKG